MIEIEDKGTIEYSLAWEEQKRQFERFLKKKEENPNGSDSGARGVLLLCEHPHVYTLGKSGVENNLLVSPEFLQRIGATYFRTDRGGDITYHGYGQLVGYPILDLESLGGISGLKEYIEALEQSVIDTVAHWNLEARRLDGAAGVWIVDEKGARKICAIGVKASRYITMHGFALNVTTDLDYFNYINPCGFTDKKATSIEAELAGKGIPVPTLEEVKETYARQFRQLFA